MFGDGCFVIRCYVTNNLGIVVLFMGRNIVIDTLILKGEGDFAQTYYM